VKRQPKNVSPRLSEERARLAGDMKKHNAQVERHNDPSPPPTHENRDKLIARAERDLDDNTREFLDCGLKHEERLVCLLIYCDDEWSETDAAAILGRPTRTVANWHKAAKKKIETHVKKKLPHLLRRRIASGATSPQ
jgi:DNA-directed RNA polymerase specialized sigma24 family protein